MNITELEAKIIQNIVENEMSSGNGAVLEDFADTGGGCWTDCIIDSGPHSKIPETSLGGIMASLVKKGLVWTDGVGRDGGSGITEEGFAEYKRTRTPK